MMRVMMKVAVGWMRMGLPLQLFKIVVYARNPTKLGPAEKEAIGNFEMMKKSIERTRLKIEVGFL